MCSYAFIYMFRYFYKNVHIHSYIYTHICSHTFIYIFIYCTFILVCLSKYSATSSKTVANIHHVVSICRSSVLSRCPLPVWLLRTTAGVNGNAVKMLPVIVPAPTPCTPLPHSPIPHTICCIFWLRVPSRKRAAHTCQASSPVSLSVSLSLPLSSSL